MNKNGVGLGLSICKNLIEQMAGSVDVESKEGFGTKFIVNFSTSCLLENEKTDNIQKILISDDSSSTLSK